MKSIVVYGATGYTGSLITNRLLEQGVRPILGGRDESRVRAKAEPLGLDSRCANLADPSAVDALVDDSGVLLNAAGPFSSTAAPLAEACIRTGNHYLDVTGEVDVIDLLAERHHRARERNTLLLPAVGYDIVPSDCLAAHVARRLPFAESLAIGIEGLRFMTPGSAKTFVKHARSGVRVRHSGRLQTIRPGSDERLFHFSDRGPSWAVCVSLPDVASAYFTTGIPNIRGYYAATPEMRSVVTAWRLCGGLIATAPLQALLQAAADLVWAGPTDAQRSTSSTTIVAVAQRRDRQVISRLHTPEPYELTARTAATAAIRVAAGEVGAGFTTPARHFGEDFILSFPETRIEEVL